MEHTLEEARAIINEVDAKMAELFVRRMRAAELVYAHKRKFGLPILDQERENAVIERNGALIEDEVLRGYYMEYIRNVMSISRAYQYRMQNGLKVAYSGVAGAFAQIAAGRIFPGGTMVPCSGFQGAYDAVVSGTADAAVLPIENSCAGEVGQTMDLIFSGPLFVNGVYTLEIQQNLLGVPGAVPEDIKKVISHPQALSQCRTCIEERGWKTEEVGNTALAAQWVAEQGDKSVGAIASVETAGLYGLRVLAEHINERGENTTRFVVLSGVRARTAALPSTILMFTVRHEVGSLANAISIIGKYGYNMTALRSRPLRKHPWQYYFYIELDGSTDTPEGEQMLKELGQVCDKLKIAGSFSPHAPL